MVGINSQLIELVNSEPLSAKREDDDVTTLPLHRLRLVGASQIYK